MEKLEFSSRNIALFAIGIVPILARRINIGGIGIIIPIVWALFALQVFMKRGKLLRLNNKVYLYYFIMCFLYLRDGSFMDYISLITDTLILFALVADGIKSEDDYFKCIRILALVSSILAVLAIIETFTDFNLFDLIANSTVEKVGANGYRYGLTRARGPFTTPINYCVYLLFSLGAIVYGLLNDLKGKTFWVIAWILSVAAALCTLSRAPMLSIALSQILIFWKAGIFSKLKTYVKVLVAIAIITLMGYFYDFSIITDTVDKIFAMFVAVIKPDVATAITSSGEFGINADGVGQRLILFVWIAEEINKSLLSFLFGTGVGTGFSKVVSNIFTKTSIENHYLSVLFHTGVIGLAVECSLLVGILVFIKKSNSRLMTECKISFASMMMISTLLYYVTMFTVDTFDDKRIFVVLLAILFAKNKVFMTSER